MNAGMVWPVVLLAAVASMVVGLLIVLNRRLAREIGVRSQAQAGLRVSESRYRSLVESAPLALVAWDRDRRVIDWNAQAEQIFGWRKAEVLGRDLATFMVPEAARGRIEDLVKSAFDLGIESRALSSNLTRDGRTIEVEWHNTVLKDSQDRPTEVLSLAYDVTERIRSQAALQSANDMLRRQLEEIHALQTELREQVVRDSLTGLYNRRYLDDALQAEVSRAIRSGEPLAVMMLDIDHFKRVNDTYGHQVGDEVLRMLAGLLRRGARRSDVACRYGGEEFVLLLPNMNLDSATERAEQWRRAFAETELVVDDRRLQCTLSVGIAVFPEHGDSAEALLRSADRALYLAKALGRNRVVIYGSPPPGGQ